MKRVDLVKRAIEIFPEGLEIDGKKIELCISSDEISSLLASYDPTDSESPDIATCRALARLILDALLADE